MNGIDFIADTNFLINVYEGNKIVEPFLDYNFATSYISEIELFRSIQHKQNSKKRVARIAERMHDYRNE